MPAVYRPVRAHLVTPSAAQLEAARSRLGSDDWQLEARCRETDPELFFPEQGKSVEPARRICGPCPVRTVCLASALTRTEQFGVWAGLTYRQLRDLRSLLARDVVTAAAA